MRPLLYPSRFDLEIDGINGPAALAVMHRATKDLAESGILARTVKVGDMAPDFVLKNTGNQNVSLGEFTGRGPAVLSLYRGRG